MKPNDLKPPVPAESPGHPAQPSRDWSSRVTWSYVVGVYTAVNAIRDAWVLVEGPDCAHLKTQYLQGNHDWNSTLTSVSGFHRVANTALHPVHMTRSREKAIHGALTQIAGHPATSGLLMTSMPMASVTGADYARLCAEVTESSHKPVVHVPGRSLSGDWMDGYAETLFSLARRLDLTGGTPIPDKVAIVGYLHDRNEGDHRANVRMLREMLAAIDLDVTSIWLEGQAFADLCAVRDAGTILSFPYGRKAAAWIAQRTGARLIECELPFGPAATERWLRQVGNATGREGQAEALIERELAECIPPLEWVVPHVFQHRRLAWIGDPHMVRGFKEFTDLVGARLVAAVITNPTAHSAGLAQFLGEDVRLLVWPRLREMLRFLSDVGSDEPIDLLVTNQAGVGQMPVATVEFGFPTLYTHCLYERPFLGFRGFLAFADQLANAISQRGIFEAGSTPTRTWHGG